MKRVRNKNTKKSVMTDPNKNENKIDGKSVKKLFTLRRTIVLVLVIAAMLIGAFVYSSRPTEIDKLTENYVDTLKPSIVRENVPATFKDVYKAADSTFYGETLSMFGNAYDSDSDTMDPFMGKPLVLHNIETGKEYNFTFSGSADNAIPLGQLDEGVYEIYIYDQYTKKRVYFDKKTETEPFYTMRRNGKVKSITLEADQDLFRKYNTELDKNYAFLVVKDTIPKSNVIDVIIDPSGNLLNVWSQELETGYVSDTIKEADASLELAEKVKSELEKYGLKVIIDRDAHSTPGYYGADGRVGQGYDHQAKVFLSLSMCDLDAVSRPFFMVSPLTNASLANEMAFVMNENGIQLDYPYTSTDLLASGVVFDTQIVDNEYNVTNYTLEPALRESGGKVTFAGQYNQIGNAEYSDRFGMYGVIFDYANVNSQDSINYFNENKDTIARSLAQGIAAYYQLQEVNENETSGK